MRKLAVTLVVLGLAACGGDDDAAAEPVPEGEGDAAASDEDDGDAGGDASGGGDVVNAQPPGRAFVAVDGQEFTLEEPGALDCSIADDAITFSFRIGDNEVTLGAGANRDGDDWYGGIVLAIADPAGEDGPISYFPEFPADSAGMTIDGASASYSGPMQKQPPNDGSNPPPVDVGDGVISVTCA